MPAQLRKVRQRIRSVESTMKITRAFELISASRVVRATQRVEQARPYTEAVTTSLSHVASTETHLSHPLLERRAEVNSAAVLVVTSDRGLAGPYNANVLRTAEELQAHLREDGLEPKLYVTGRKGVTYYRFRQREIEQSWTGFSHAPAYDDARAVVDALVDAFLHHRVDQIHAVYTAFVPAAPHGGVGGRFVPVGVQGPEERPPEPIPQYVFEPSPERLL